MKIENATLCHADWVRFDTLAIDAARRMKAEDIGALLVGKNDRLVGMVTGRDLALRVLAEGRDVLTTTVGDVMSPGVVYCRTNQNIEEAMQLMGKRKIRQLPVLNDEKRMIGILNLQDIVHL